MGPLNQQLSALRAEKDAGRDPEVTAVMNASTEDLRARDILSGMRQVADPAPLFARPNLDGKSVRLRNLIKQGPTVVSFFRGRW